MAKYKLFLKRTITQLVNIEVECKTMDEAKEALANNQSVDWTYATVTDVSNTDIIDIEPLSY